MNFLIAVHKRSTYILTVMVARAQNEFKREQLDLGRNFSNNVCHRRPYDMRGIFK